MLIDVRMVVRSFVFDGFSQQQQQQQQSILRRGTKKGLLETTRQKVTDEC